MQQMSLIKQRLEAGDRIWFYQDFYGRQWIELRNFWVFWKKKKIKLDPEEVSLVKAMIRSRKAITS